MHSPVRHRPRTEDRAGTQVAVVGQAGQQLAEAPVHLATVGITEPFPVAADAQIEMNAPVLPGLAQLVGGHCHRRKDGSGLGVDDAEPGLHFPEHMPAHADVVEQGHQADMRLRLLGAARHRQVIDDHRELAFKIPLLVLTKQRVVLTGADEIIALTLDQDRNAGRLLDRQLVGLLHDATVVEERRGIDELEGSRQRRHCLMRLEGEFTCRRAAVQTLGQGLQTWLAARPVVERSTHGRRHFGRVQGALQIAGDDDQTPIPTAIFQGRELHPGSPSLSGCMPRALMNLATML